MRESTKIQDYILTGESADELFDESDDEIEESVDMGSFNHSTVQANLTFLAKRPGKYTVSTELSLDISNIDTAKLDPKYKLKIKDEIKPDICIYPKRKLSRPYDILKMTEMPLVAIEILSPRQGLEEILQKFEVYFQLGVKSCWLVDPITEIVTIYTSLETRKVFSEGEVYDPVIDIRLLLDEIFE